MSEIKSYRDLIVWQKSMDLVVRVYDAIKGFPKNEEYCISAQIRRCSVSIPSNISEGYGRKSRADYSKFLQYSRGSLYELLTQLELSYRLNYIDEKLFSLLENNCIEIEKMLNALISKLSK